MKKTDFYSKILLFGEYGIIKNSKGLSIPYNSYKGCLKTKKTPCENASLSNTSLKYFAAYLTDVRATHDGVSGLDLEKLIHDIDQGLYFDSSIPQGYGVGSSGALVAAIYAAYSHDPIAQSTTDRTQILELKTIFGVMESFFHGTSSGLDPLNSYLSSPILIHNHLLVEPTHMPVGDNQGEGVIFLLDSGQVGQTAPMVKIFMQNMQEERFSSMLKTHFIHHTNGCVDCFLSRDIRGLFAHVKSLSGTVLEHFKPMIPAKLHDVWRKGIESNDYYLKLCGSGGGGYILGFTRDIEKAKMALKDYRLEVVCRV